MRSLDSAVCSGLPRSRLGASILVGVIAFAIRLFYLWQLRDSDAMIIITGDTRSYHEWAMRIAGGDWIGKGTFYQAPLYPYFMAAVYSVFGVSLTALRVVQTLTGAASCALLSGAASYLLNRRLALIAGLLLAVYPMAVFSDVIIQKSVLDLFFLSAFLFVAAREYRYSSPYLWLLAGAVLGLLCLVRENALVFIPAVLLWLFMEKKRGNGRGVLFPVLLFAAGLLLTLGPVVLRNGMVGGDYVLTTSQLGPNLYIGNNPKADGTYVPLVPGHADPFYEAADARRLAEESLGRKLSASEVSSYWTHKTFDYATGSTGEWLRLTGRKAMLMVNAVEIGDSDMPYAYAEWSGLLWTLQMVFHFGVLFPLALGGLFLSWKFWRRRWLFLILPALYSASVVLFYVMARYRLPVTPFLILFAAGGLGVLSRNMIKTRRTVAIAALCVTLITVVASNWRLFPNPRLDQIVIMENNLGVGMGMMDGGVDKALPHFRKAIGLAPNFVEPKKRLGLLLVKLGRFDEARPYLLETFKLEAGDPDTHIGLGVIADKNNRPEESLDWYGRALAINPDLAPLQTRVGNILMNLGRVGEAIPHFTKAAQLSPDSPQAHFYLGSALKIANSLAGAEEEMKKTIALAPDVPDAYAVLGEIYALQNRHEESRRYFEKARTLSAGSGK